MRHKQAGHDFNSAYAAHLSTPTAMQRSRGRCQGRGTLGGRAKDGTGDGVLGGACNEPPPAGDPMTALTVNAAGGETLNYWWHLRPRI